MTIEVERRGLLDEGQYQRLQNEILANSGTDLGENNTQTDFYLTSSSQAKVQYAISKDSAKIAWKSGGNDGVSAREEVEIGISAQDLPAARLLLSKLIPDAQHFETQQKRHDFRLGEVHIALKHSEDWGYHVELEVMADTQEDVLAAERAINKVADQLDIKLLSQAEEKEFVEKRIAERGER